MRWLIGLAALYGHPPEETRTWSVRDLQLLEAAHHIVREQHPLWEI